MSTIKTKPRKAVPPPAAGYAAQPWIARPTRAGWWWNRLDEKDRPKLWRVIPEPHPPGETALVRKLKWAMTICEEGGIVPPVTLEWVGGEWSGPVELEKAPDAQRRHTGRITYEPNNE